MPGSTGASRPGARTRAPFDLDDADPADVDRGQALEIAQGRGVDALGAAGVEDRRARPARVTASPSIVSSTTAEPRAPAAPRVAGSTGPAGSNRIGSMLTGSTEHRAAGARSRWRSRPSGRGRRSRRRASPGRPRAAARSPSSADPFGRPATSRARSSSWRTVPTRQGTHWPHDSSRKNAAIRRRAPTRSAVSSKTMTTPEPSVAPIARVPSKVSGMSSASGPTNTPAAPPSRIAWIAPAAGHAAGELDQLAQRRPERHLVDARAARRAPDRQNSFGSGRALGADRRERRAAVEHDRRDVDQRLDVVDDGRLAEQPDLDRERRLVARLAALALDRLEERRLLAADVGAGAAPDLDVEGERRSRGCRARAARPRGRGRSRPAIRASASGYSPRM